MFPEASTGEDPPEGASINYWLKEKNDNVKIVITDKKNDTIKIISDKGHKGINRIWWDFSGEKTRDVIFRTKPLYAEWFPLDENRERKGAEGFSIQSPPGTYNVSLNINGKTITKKLEVIKDPNSEGTIDDILLQNDLVREVYKDLNLTISHVNTIEKIRRQLLDLKITFKNTKQKSEIISLVEKLESKFLNLELKFVQLKITGKGQDEVRYEKKLLEKLAYLASNIQISDFKPANSYLEVHQILRERLVLAEKELNKLINFDLKSMQDNLNEIGIGMIITD